MDYETLLKNNIEERNRIKDEIKVLEEDIFKYQNRGDFSSVNNCIEKKVRLKANLAEKEKEISRLERIIKNNGLDPYAPVPLSNSPNNPTNLPIDDGTISTTMTIDIEFEGTKGQGKDKQNIYQTHSQSVNRVSEINNGEIINQVSNVDTISSKQTQKKLERNISRDNLINSTGYNNKIYSNRPISKRNNSKSPRERYEKKKMKLFISNLKSGKTWNQAAAFSQISPTTATEWYEKGKNNFSKNTSFFYKEINYLENHNKLNWDDFKKNNDNKNSWSKNINRNERKKMNSFLKYIKQGFSWEESAKLSNILQTQATIWYRRGSKDFSDNTTYFYNQLKKLNISPKLIDNENFAYTAKNKIADSNDVSKDNDDIIDVNVVEGEKNSIDIKNEIPNEKETIITDENLIKDKKSKMNLIIFNLKEGNSLEKTSEIVGISTDIINGWIIKGKNSNIEYVDFYNQCKLIGVNMPIEYFKSSKTHDESKLEYNLEKRIEKLDLIHEDFNNVKVLSKKIDENISQEEFKSRLQDLIAQFKSKKQEKQKELEINEKIIASYGFLDCKTIEDFENKKIQIKNDLNDVEEEITEARLKNKLSIVISLQSKKARYKTQLLDIDNIIQLLSKQGLLEQDIGEINDKIKDLEKKLNAIQDERKQMDEFLEIYRDVKSCEDAVKLSSIKKQRIVNWIHEGRNRTNANKIYFFNEFNKIKNQKERIRRGEELRKLKTKQISQLLTQLRNGKTKVQACKIVGISITTFYRWYDNGKNNGSDENVDFYKQVIEIKQMQKFLKVFKKFKSPKKAINKTNMPDEQIRQWILDGKQQKNENAIYFYNEFQKINKNIEKTSSSNSSSTQINITDNNSKINNYVPKNSFERKQREYMVNVISEMKKGYSKYEAAIICNIPISTVKKWYNQGKNSYSDNTAYFYKNVNLIEPENNELAGMNKIIEEVKKGKSLKKAAESVNIPIRLVNFWFDNGKRELNKNTIYFYEQIQNENQKEFYKMGRVLDALNKGMDKHDACKIADVSVSKLNSWIIEGRNGENKNAEYFIKEYDKINLNEDKKINLKKCPNCGKLVDKNHNFCNMCGYSFNSNKKKKRSISDRLKGFF